MNFFDETTRTFIKAIGPIAFFIALKMGMSLAEDYFELGANTAGNLLIEMGIAFVAYSILLHGTYKAETGGFRPHAGKFVWRFVLLFIFAFFGALSTLVFTIALSETAVVIGVLVGFGLFLLIELSLFGTMLPATVDGTDRSWGAAWRRGKRTFWSVFWRLLVGPGIIMLLGIAVIAMMPTDGKFAVDGQIQWLTMLTFLPLVALSMFASVMVAVILTQAYLRVEVQAASYSDPNHGFVR